MNFKPINISLLIGTIAVLYYLLTLALKNDFFHTSVEFERLLIGIKGVFSIACFFGLALGAMNFKNQRFLSVIGIGLNILGAILK